MLNQDAIAIGTETASEETKRILCDWSDIIILVDATLQDEILQKCGDKLRVWDVGPDRYFRGFDLDLLQQYQDYLNGQVMIIEHAKNN
jgi:hypothetical protein